MKIKEHRTQWLSLRWKCYDGEVVTQDKMRSRLIIREKTGVLSVAEKDGNLVLDGLDMCE